ncbi:hypothetical protein FUA26_04015 [Seonamhaeicola algicola]|uniref:Bacterial Pleckstrin homology domain-containing protein n=1 Tax=Seonamhaeicola algicola TaxID=1719036 RepID=A0A5C7AWB5_9FLAO|nr:hypothetical protein [Seonamhaeicola algicola]TXE12968.1 hypothetical protein FUA26_04015 [Seonamhaeicola algicola]
MKSVVLKQKLSFTVLVQFVFPISVGLCVLTFFFSFLFFPFFIISLLWLFGSYNYVFNENGNHKIQYKTLNILLFTRDKAFLKPDYVSLFQQSFKQTLGFGFLEFGKARYKDYTIKLFSENKHKIVYITSRKVEVLLLGKKLSEVLNVELYNALK